MEIDCVYLSFDTCQEEAGGIVYVRLFALLCGYMCTVESVAWSLNRCETGTFVHTAVCFSCFVLFCVSPCLVLSVAS
jgi:hypothetical protein